MVSILSALAFAWVVFAFYVVISDFFAAQDFQVMGLASWTNGTSAVVDRPKALGAHA